MLVYKKWFYPGDSNYRCCWGFLHITTATKIVCYSNIVLLIIASILHYNSEKAASSTLIASTIMDFISLILPFYGIRVENYLWLVPFLIVMGFKILICAIILAISLITILFNGREKTGDDALDEWYAAVDEGVTAKGMRLAVISIFFAIVHVWLFAIVFQCCRYLKAQKAAETLPMRQCSTTSTTTPKISIINSDPTSYTSLGAH